MQHDELLTNLVRALRAHDITQQEQSIEALRQTDRTADVLGLLSGTLETDDARLKVRAIELMNILGDTRAIEPLVYALNDTEKLVRQTAVLALAQLDFQGTISHLLDRLDDDAWEVRRAIIRALGEAKNVEYYIHFATAMRDDSKWVRADAAWALGELHDARSVHLLVKALRDPDWQVRRAATNALVKIGEPAIHPLIGVLPFEEYGVQIFALEALGKLQAMAAFDAVIEMLDDEDIQTKRAAVTALGLIGNPVATPYLLDFLQHDDLYLCLAVLRALGQLQDPRATLPVIEVALADDPILVMEARKTIVLLGDAAVPELVPLLYENDRRTVQFAQQMLHAIGSASAREAIKTWREAG